MGTNDPIGGVGIGLGKKGDPGSGIATGGNPGGTAVLRFGLEDMQGLMAAHGQVMEEIVGDFPIQGGVMRASLCNARITSVQTVGGVAQVTLQYMWAYAGPVLPSATYDTTRSNIKTNRWVDPVLPSANYNTSKSNVKNASFTEMQALTPGISPGAAMKAISSKGISGI